MSISTYAELQQAILDWTHRADLSNFTADFITIATARLMREIRSVDMEQRTTSTLDSTTPYVTVPTDLHEVKAVWLTSGGLITRLDYLPPNALLQMYPTASASGEPDHYTIIGSEFRFGPWPDSNYTVEIWYFKRLPALSSSLSTLFTNSPDLYFFAAMVEAHSFMKDANGRAYWEARYQDIKNQVNQSEEGGRRAPGMQMVAM